MVSKRQKQLFIDLLPKHFSEALQHFYKTHVRKSFETGHLSFSFKFEKNFQNAWRLLLERAMVKTDEILRNMGIAGSAFRVAPNKYTPCTQDVN